MRSVIWLVLLFVAAVVAAAALGRNDALVSLFYGEWRLDMSLNLFLLGMAATVFVLFGSLQAIQSLLSLPLRAREWRALKRERAAQAALREAQAELFAARYARAHRAAQRALDLQVDVPSLKDDREFTILAHLLAATGQHHLQDKKGRDDRVTAAQARASSGSASEGILLLAAEWALDDRDAGRGMALLGELPPGVARRTQALRLKLQAARQRRKPLEALQTARLLAKHQGFSSVAAQSLLRSLAFEALDQAFDEGQLKRVWQGLDDADRRDAWVVARAAQRAAKLGHLTLAQSWLMPAWEQAHKLDVEAREQLALALVFCADGLGSQWLPTVEAVLAQHGREPAVVAAAGMAFAQRQLWGKARRLLEQTASAESLSTPVRRLGLRTLARIARQEGDELVASNCDQRAAALD
ncbi:heme biosynthesis protein HemY [Ideonella azotifigens]|uniref:Heme biosynthesis protein HemY n=1 Tax=Ideonella azotifigens TaxID=513160 RepID=A0ABN1K220_9BURK|nr:heme biosynthesis HemY N-terminal domain-containing protein [Ideonella azotifigens]MCD2341814.1 heme biosynthesis protein HemY [Ideonella azotifigens]